jgi:ABC-type glycerol-3-phosphate transport system permease component
VELPKLLHPGHPAGWYSPFANVCHLNALFLYAEKLFTLPLALTRFRVQYYTQWANMMAGATISLTPILLIFLFTQQYFVRGVVLSGLKG